MYIVIVFMHLYPDCQQHSVLISWAIYLLCSRMTDDHRIFCMGKDLKISNTIWFRKRRCHIIALKIWDEFIKGWSELGCAIETALGTDKAILPATDEWVLLMDVITYYWAGNLLTCAWDDALINLLFEVRLLRCICKSGIRRISFWKIGILPESLICVNLW